MHTFVIFVQWEASGHLGCKATWVYHVGLESDGDQTQEVTAVLA